MNLNDPGRTRRSNSRRTNSSEESTRKNPRLVTNYLIELVVFCDVRHNPYLRAI